MMESKTTTTSQHSINPDFEFIHHREETLEKAEYHKHDFYEIFFFISGKVSYLIEGKAYTPKNGDIFLLNNRELHKHVIETSQIYERIIILVNPDFIKRHSSQDTNLFECFESSSKRKYNLLRLDPEMLSTIRNTVALLKKVCLTKSYGSEILKENYLTELIVYLNKAYMETYADYQEKDVFSDPKVNNIIQYINQNLSEDLSLEALSLNFYTSKYHLLREFRRHTGYTPHEYVHQKRLISAKALLKEGISITEICQLCGFKDYANFFRVFQKAYNISPRKYASQFLV